MSEEEKHTLFQKFGVLESSRNMNHNGLGLGLYISKAILNKLGGDISWKSAKGVGTTFTIKFVVDTTKDVSYLRDSEEYIPKPIKGLNLLPNKLRFQPLGLDPFIRVDEEITEEIWVVAKRPYEFVKTNDKRDLKASPYNVRLKL